MIILACIIIWILCDILEDNSRERDYYDRRAERRHKELMDSRNSNHLKERQNKKIRTTVRELIDEEGRVIRETVTEEFV